MKKTMAVPHWFVGFDSLMEIAGSAIALGIAYYALRGYRLTKERTLFFLHFSFALIGVGLLTDGIVTLPPISSRLSLLTGLGYLFRMLTEIVGYGLLLFTYLRRTKQTLTESALAVTLLPYNPFLELVVFFLLAYITVQCAMNYGVRKERNALLVFAAFLLLSISHLLAVFPPIFPLLFVVAHSTQLLGFIALLTMLIRVAEAR
jgi:hypothetical protein